MLSVGGGAATGLAEHYGTEATQECGGESDRVEVVVRTEMDASFDAGNVDSLQATITWGGPMNTEYAARFTETDPIANEFRAEIEVVEGGGASVRYPSWASLPER